MSEEDPQQLQAERGTASVPSLVPGLLSGLQGAEASALQIRIKNSICKSVQSKVENILQDVEKFSDIEKLYLYLKLPSGPSSGTDKCDQSALTSSRTQQMHAFNWILNHLEEYPETSLPKQEVYDEYKSFCDNLNYHPLSAADFGKMMKNVFPNMKARRLGMRGKSKYCYSGLRKRPLVHVPSLPSLDLHKPGEGCDMPDSPAQMSGIKEEVHFAACDLVCEWAQKVLKRQFDALEDLARFLVSSHCISNKSLAAVTVMTGTATEGRTQQSISAFVPTTDVHTFQPQVTTLSSSSVDAKQQLQRKIQRKQQELKLHSPTPGESQTQRVDEGIPCNSPTTPSPQPALGIVVATVPSPIMTQRYRQLLSPSPVPTVESKMLPVNFQMVTKPITAVKQSLKTPQNVVSSPAGSARQRYAQILPKPLATTTFTLHSPSTMIIANNPIKTVMTTCHVSPISLVKMAIPLTSNSCNSSTSLTNTTLRPASAGISSSTVSEKCPPSQSMRSSSTVPILAPVTMTGQGANSYNMDVEMEVEAIHKNSQSNVAYPCEGTKQRAASVPIPQTKGLLGLEELSFSNFNEKPSLSTVTVANTTKSNNNTDNTSSLHSPLCTHNSSPVSSMDTSSAPLFGVSSNITFAKEGFLSTKNRKRSGNSQDYSPSKRIFMPHQTVEGIADTECGIRATLSSRHGAPVRPESAPASRELEMKMNSVLSSHVHTSFGASSFYSVAKTQSSAQRKNIPTVMESHISLSHALLQQHQGQTQNNVSKPSVSNILSSSSSAGSMNEAAQIYAAQYNPASENLDFQTDVDYFSFDDVTQDSFVGELVQMEEQMKLQEFGNCYALQGQQPRIQNNMSNNQTMNPYYPAANSRSNPIQTPTPTPTSEMIGGAQVMTGESPCSRMASTTPVDSALGSSRHTPVGTPHSNCSSTVPPSPVECRDPFAFTPINSSNTGFYDNSSVTNGPVKPMQRPMATHPDKTRLEWMNNSYNNSSGSINNKSNSGIGIVPNYQGLIDNHFQKPHAFAVNENNFGRLTPISPVQQQVAIMANMNKQEGFAVPAPLDNKANSNHLTTFRCRSVSPAVHQRILSSNTGNGALSNAPRSVVSPFNSPVTPEVLNIFANNQANLGVSSMAQRSRSVPLNIMMQTREMPSQGQQSSTKNLSNVLLSKLERAHDDTLQGLGMNNLPLSYSAPMNLSQILESDPNLSCSNNHLILTPDSTNPCYHNQNTVNEQLVLATDKSHVQSTCGDQPQHQIPMMLMQHQQLDFSCTVKDNSLTAGGVVQVSELNTGAADFPCGIRMAPELSTSFNDLNALDTNLLFDPTQQQGQYQHETSEELVNNTLFQQITSETAHSGVLDWLESKDHPPVGLMS